MKLLSSLFTGLAGQARAVGLTLFRSRSLRGSFLLILLGAALWVKREWPAPVTDSSSPPAVNATEPAAAVQHSPLPFRLGAGFAGGFLLSFAFRRFLKATALFAGLLLAAVAAVRALGWVDLDWNALEHEIHSALSWTHERALSVKAVLESYLPATAASGFGLWRGWRKGGQAVTGETA